MKKFLIALTTGITLYLLSSTAWADTITYEKAGTDNVVVVKDDNGNWKSSHYYDKDWKYIESEYASDSNPNPVGGEGGGTGDPKNAVKDSLALILQNGGAGPKEVEFWASPLGKALTSKGMGSKYNQSSQPGPNDNPGGPGTGAPNKDNLGKGIKEAGIGQGGQIGGIEFQPNSGGVKEFANKNKGKKGKKGGGGKPSKSDSVGQGAMWGDLPGPPELVNPDPVTRSRAKGKQPSAAMQLPSAAAGPGTSAAPRTHGVGKLR